MMADRREEVCTRQEAEGGLGREEVYPLLAQLPPTPQRSAAAAARTASPAGGPALFNAAATPATAAVPP
jgi:hypothetical protein